jgi:hypothetical protein
MLLVALVDRRIAVKAVPAIAADEYVTSTPADQRVFAGRPRQDVSALAAAKGIVAIEPHNGVISIETANDVRSIGAHEPVICGRANDGAWRVRDAARGGDAPRRKGEQGSAD